MDRTGQEITWGKIFSVFVIVNTLWASFESLGFFFGGFAEWKVSLTLIAVFVNKHTSHGSVEDNLPPKSMRVQSFTEEEEDTEVISISDVSVTSGDPVSFSCATFVWSDNEPAIENGTFWVKKGEFVGVVGKVGSGKSALAQSILGELKRNSGCSTVNRSIVYVPQQAWVLNRTVQDNILFWEPYNEGQYSETVRVSGVEQDVALMAAGDMTEICEQGSNMSGGQKQRLSIARAIHTDWDIIILDDPLSALDMDVGRYVLNEGVLGFLKDRTRTMMMMMMTNQLYLLPFVDHIIVLNKGSIAFNGTCDELGKKKELSHLFTSTMNAKIFRDEKEEGVFEPKPTRMGGTTVKIRKGVEPLNHDDDDESELDLDKTPIVSQSPSGGKTTVKEEREDGQVSIKMWGTYLKWGGFQCLLLILVFWCGCYFNVLLFSLEMSESSSCYDVSSSSSSLTHSSLHTMNKTCLTLLGIILVSDTTGTFMFMFSWSVKDRFTSDKFQNTLSHSLVPSPVSFYDVTLMGRIVTWFSNHLSRIDKRIPTYLEYMATMLYLFLSTMQQLSVSRAGTLSLCF